LGWLLPWPPWLSRSPSSSRRPGQRVPPGHIGRHLAAAAVSFVVLMPLAYAKRRLGGRMAIRALHGDGALSGIGAASSLLALTALVLYDALVWWQADRVAA
jgi:divalent metal cation (Fe/Co/Zn/Cd) transporter